MRKLDKRKIRHCVYLRLTYARNCVSNFGVHMHVLDVVKVYRPEGESLSH